MWSHPLWRSLVRREQLKMAVTTVKISCVKVPGPWITFAVLRVWAVHFKSTPFSKNTLGLARMLKVGLSLSLPQGLFCFFVFFCSFEKLGRLLNCGTFWPEHCLTNCLLLV